MSIFTRLMLVMSLLLTLGIMSASGQDNLVAVLEVLEAGVEVQPNGAATWVRVNRETLISAGDRIRTDITGEARLTFFEDGTAAEITPDTEVLVTEFNGDEQRFDLTLDIVGGIVRQQVNALLDADSNYRVITPGMTMSVRGTQFDIRVEEGGRSALLATDGEVETAADADPASVTAGFGVRSEPDAPLSDVVKATSFEELDAALDGCSGDFSTEGDVRLYVRLGASSTATQVGSIDPSEIENLLGATRDGMWYRIPFRGGFGWVSTMLMDVGVNEACVGLRQYDETPPLEDPALYTSLDLDGDDALVLVEGSSLRERPGTEYALLEALPLGAIVQIIGVDPSQEWVQVRTLEGIVGWVAFDLLEVYGSPADFETIEEPAPTAEPTESSN